MCDAETRHPYHIPAVGSPAPTQKHLHGIMLSEKVKRQQKKKRVLKQLVGKAIRKRFDGDSGAIRVI